MDIRRGDALLPMKPVRYDSERIEALLGAKRTGTAHLVSQLFGIYRELQGNGAAELVEASTKGKDILLQKAIVALQDAAKKLSQDSLQAEDMKARIQEVAYFSFDIEMAGLEERFGIMQAQLQAALRDKDEKALRLLANRKNGDALLLTQFIKRHGKS